MNQAALNLVRASNPNDEVFGVNFKDEYYLDQDFTYNLLKLKEALEKIDARGGTALYDAVVASTEHLKRNARLEKKCCSLSPMARITSATKLCNKRTPHPASTA